VSIRITPETIASIAARVRERRPLVHHITNDVTPSECANIVLCAGALPVMAPSVEESAEMAANSGALVLNIGTPSTAQVESMLSAARAANDAGVPVLLDPVGAGATELRTRSARRILKEVEVSIIRGNAAECAVLAGMDAQISGVESLEVNEDSRDVAKALAGGSGCTVALTGETDVVTDGERTVLVLNGSPMMRTVVGTGCMSTSVVGAFAAVESDTVAAAAAGLTCFGIAGELADCGQGPGTYRMALFDYMAEQSREDIELCARIETR